MGVEAAGSEDFGGEVAGGSGEGGGGVEGPKMSWTGSSSSFSSSEGSLREGGLSRSFCFQREKKMRQFPSNWAASMASSIPMGVVIINMDSASEYFCSDIYFFPNEERINRRSSANVVKDEKSSSPTLCRSCRAIISRQVFHFCVCPLSSSAVSLTSSCLAFSSLLTSLVSSAYLASINCVARFRRAASHLLRYTSTSYLLCLSSIFSSLRRSGR
mmetsp:Transcript_40970/g.96188  ORF Transcript_40970/g.96188 Transcript_40970/m.96188 type:complete len:215 (-) Transcript_40970:316-960(-)